MTEPKFNQQGSVAEVARLGLKLGVTAFGGPAAHIAMLRQDVVDRRQWLSQAHFLDLIGLTNLIPGPNSTEMVMHVGYKRARYWGLVAAGVSFILPAALITLGFAVAYERYGSTPSGEHFLYGIKPVVVAVILQAIWALGRVATKNAWRLISMLAVAVAYIAGVSELLLLFGGAMAVAMGERAVRAARGRTVISAEPLSLLHLMAILQSADPVVSYSATRLFLQFLKIGAVLYGSGYVLIAFLRSTFVQEYGWITEAQLIDAVAIGQVTPGPVFTTATFVGYLTGGYAGALLATIAIFLPSFLFVALSGRFLPTIRKRVLLGDLLDGVNLAAVGLMAGVTWQLGAEAIVDPQTAALFVGAGALLLGRNVNSAVLIAIGALCGLISGVI